MFLNKKKLLEAKSYYYIDSDGKRHDFMVTKEDYFAQGKEGYLYKLGDICIKLLHTFDLNEDTASGLQKIPKQESVMLLDDLVYEDNGCFTGYTNPFHKKQQKLDNFKCYNFIKSYLSAINAFATLGRYSVLADDLESRNVLFNGHDIIFYDPGIYIFEREIDPEILSTLNLKKLDELILRLYSILLRKNAKTITQQFLCFKLVKDARKAEDKYAHFSSELGQFETFSEYLSSKTKASKQMKRWNH